MSAKAASQLIWGSGALLERTCLARWLAGTGAECRFSAAQLLSAVAVVVAGRDQGGAPRPRQHPGALRPPGQQPPLCGPASERAVAANLRQAPPASPVPPIQRVPAPPRRPP